MNRLRCACLGAYLYVCYCCTVCCCVHSWTAICGAQFTSQLVCVINDGGCDWLTIIVWLDSPHLPLQTGLTTETLRCYIRLFCILGLNLAQKRSAHMDVMGVFDLYFWSLHFSWHSEGIVQVERPVFWPVCSDVMGSCVSVRGAKMAVSVTVLLQMSI